MASHGVAYTSFPGADRAVAQLLRVLLRRAGNKSEGFNMESRITTGECISTVLSMASAAICARGGTH